MRSIAYISKRLLINSTSSQSCSTSDKFIKTSIINIIINYLRDFQSPPPVHQAALALEPKRQQLGRGRPSLWSFSFDPSILLPLTPCRPCHSKFYTTPKMLTLTWWTGVVDLPNQGWHNGDWLNHLPEVVLKPRHACLDAGKLGTKSQQRSLQSWKSSSWPATVSGGWWERSSADYRSKQTNRLFPSGFPASTWRRPLAVPKATYCDFGIRMYLVANVLRPRKLSQFPQYRLAEVKALL